MMGRTDQPVSFPGLFPWMRLTKDHLERVRSDHFELTTWCNPIYIHFAFLLVFLTAILAAKVPTNGQQAAPTRIHSVRYRGHSTVSEWAQYPSGACRMAATQRRCQSNSYQVRNALGGSLKLTNLGKSSYLSKSWTSTQLNVHKGWLQHKIWRPDKTCLLQKTWRAHTRYPDKCSRTTFRCL